MDSSVEKIAKILRADKHMVGNTMDYLTGITGRQGVPGKILEENEKLIQSHMLALGVRRDAGAKDVYDALISKIESDDALIFKGLGNPNCRSVADCRRIGEVAKKVVNPPMGYFLKLEKAREFVVKEPPQKVMECLGYKSAAEMVEKEDILEIYSALRFVEGGEWLNTVFFKQYENLTQED
ncbi:MAG: hypothetical protein Q7S36_02350, partial [Candidatus Liptonbacteria bacterium]|nr:hypothetical protein [Candidatus Liptonbacteria bacterium]